ncbi:MAG: cysteine--tRNA ligase [Gammaproteobacteria bacterium]
MLEIFNSLSGGKEPFEPIEPGRVRMYVCGMTVYDHCHLGHARVMVVFDLVVRYLRSRGYRVHYVRNITDIDDKIIDRARELGEDYHALTARFIEAMHEDAEALGIERPDEEPRATEAMGRIIAMIARLVDLGHAYHAPNGDVYYAVSSYPRYGQLSRKRLEELRAGARVEVADAKRDPLDFVLWKTAKPDEPYWDSPWGRGRPGWHIECSAMATNCLGPHLDIHGGGEDLKFPHHENEIAQSEPVTGQPFVNLWMHNGFVRVDEEKMSKSLGNFFTVRELLERYPAEAIRYFIVASQYRSPLNYSAQHLESAQAALARLYTALRGLKAAPAKPVEPTFLARFQAAMDDDFNTPEALAVLFDLAREINRVRGDDALTAGRLAATLRGLGELLGLLQSDPDIYLQSLPPSQEAAELSRQAIEHLIDLRNAARRDKDWARADRIRADLKARGILLEDGAAGSTWRREKI